MAAPIALDTISYIQEHLGDVHNELTLTQFAAVLTKFQEDKPLFVEDLLEFLEMCDNSKQPSFVFNLRSGW